MMRSKDNLVKPGYKMTSLGEIPEDWEVVALKEVVMESRLGGNYENAESHEGIPVIKMGNLGRGNIKTDKVQYLPVDSQFIDEDVLQTHDLLFNTRNTLELVGKVALWRNELPHAVYNSNLMRLRFNGDLIYSNLFMNFAFNSMHILNQLRKIATGTTSVAAIYDRDLIKVKIALPPLPEQEAIAETLSTWDRAIEKTQELIEQKELRKKALMQQLLTGKKRLEGFTGEWKEVRLGDVFSERNETQRNELPLLSIGSMGIYPQSDSIKKDTSNEDKSKYKRITVGDIGYNTMRMWQGRSALSHLEGIVSPAYTIVTPLHGQDGAFYSYLFKLPHTVYNFFRHSHGLVDDTLNCKFNNFAKVKVKIPLIEEQIAISKLIKTLENEIDLIGQKLEQLKLQKKGLMQVLLTGKKRIIYESN